MFLGLFSPASYDLFLTSWLKGRQSFTPFKLFCTLLRTKHKFGKANLHFLLKNAPTGAELYGSAPVNGQFLAKFDGIWADLAQIAHRQFSIISLGHTVCQELLQLFQVQNFLAALSREIAGHHIHLIKHLHTGTGGHQLTDDYIFLRGRSADPPCP